MQQNALRRKLSIASWDKPRQGVIYGKLTIDVERALEHLAKLREETGVKVTVTHFVGRVVALALRAAPGLNGVIRLGRFIPHPWVNVTFLVALEDERGQDLAKVTVEDADKKSLLEIAGELRSRARKLHDKEDEDFKKQVGLLRFVPGLLVKPLLNFVGWLTSVWGVNFPSLGLKPYPFGSVIITNVGVFALDEGFAPHVPFANVPLYVTMGRMRDEPVVRDGEIVVRKVLTIAATIDHRFMDGAQGAVLAQAVRKYFANPELLDAKALGIAAAPEPASKSELVTESPKNSAAS